MARDVWTTWIAYREGADGTVLIVGESVKGERYGMFQRSVKAIASDVVITWREEAVKAWPLAMEVWDERERSA